MRATGRSRHVLGIAVGERSLSVGQITVDGEAAGRIEAPARFNYPQGVSLEQGQALGAALRQFLWSRGWTGHRAVLGVPAKWLICKTVNVPPADDATAREMLWLHAAAHVPADLGPFTFDFLGDADSTDARDLLLLGLGNRWLDRLAAMAAGAGLKVLAIRPTAVALARAAVLRVGRPLVVCARPDGIDVVTQMQQRTVSLRHVGPISATQPLLAQVRRMLVAAPPLVSPSLGQEMDSPAIRRAWEGLVVWDEVGLPPTVWDAMEAAAAGVPVVRANLDWLGETASAPIADNAAGGGDSTGPATGAAAVALALTGRTGGSGAGGADFLHPRLIPPRQQHLRQRTLWLSAGFAAAVVAMAAIGALSDLAWVSRQVNRADDRLQVLQPALSRARPYVSTMQFASSFQPGSSRFLACLGDLTVAVPEGGSTYLTSFSLNADMSGAAAGRASSEQDVLAVLDKLRAVRRFDRLNCKLNQHQVQGRPRAPAAVPAPAATPGLQPPGAAPPGAAPPAAGGSTAPPGAPAGPTSDVTFSVSFSYLPRA